VQYRTDKAGIVHCTIGRASFQPEQLKTNLVALIEALNKAKPAGVKGRLSQEGFSFVDDGRGRPRRQRSVRLGAGCAVTILRASAGASAGDRQRPLGPQGLKPKNPTQAVSLGPGSPGRMVTEVAGNK
jgi:hypothetical protein